jgi:hypothetical protein
MRIEANGIHTKTFYQLHYKDVAEMQDHMEADEITVSDLVTEHRTGDRSVYSFIEELDPKDFRSQEALEDIAQENYDQWLDEEKCNVIDSLFLWMTYFEPRRYDEEIALKCSLIPFKLYNSNFDESTELLAYGGCGMDMSARLEAYQYLTAQTVDKNSTLYKILNGNYEDDPKDKWNEEKTWASVVGQDVLDEIKIIHKHIEID